MSVMDGVANLLSASSAFRSASPGGIVAVLLPEGATLPATTYQVVGGSSSPTFTTSGMQKVRVQFDHRSRDYVGASAARDALRAVLEGYRGTLSDGTCLQATQWIQALDYYDFEPRQFRCGAEYYLFFDLN